MSQANLPICVAALYKFRAIDDCEAVRGPLASLCNVLGVKGTLLLAREGINGTIAGPDQAIERILAHLRDVVGAANLDVKLSRAAEQPFHRMKVRLKREIVTMGEPGIDPLEDVGTYVEPEDWNALISDPATILIDTRNDYEVAVGTFRGATNPMTRTFREFPAWFRAERGNLATRGLAASGAAARIAMFCTGGIRCEKATAFLKAEGVENVFHLKGGILKYLEVVPPEESLWDGECFVFDERTTVGHGLEPGTHVPCRACRRPLSEEDRRSVLYEPGVSCPACHGERTDAQRARYRERFRQECLAEARGTAHVGVRQRCEGGDGP